jgi:hypothetical protein
MTPPVRKTNIPRAVLGRGNGSVAEQQERVV